MVESVNHLLGPRALGAARGLSASPRHKLEIPPPVGHDGREDDQEALMAQNRTLRDKLLAPFRAAKALATKKGEEVKAAWETPDLRSRIGAYACRAGGVLTLVALLALFAHFRFGNILGFEISITYPAMAASFTSMAVLKGLQFREEANLIRQQQQIQEQRRIIEAQLPEQAPAPQALSLQEEISRVTHDLGTIHKLLISEEGTQQVHEAQTQALQAIQRALLQLEGISRDRRVSHTKAEQIWKAVALIAGLALVGLFLYQMTAVFGGTSVLRLNASTLVAAVGILSYGATLIGRYFFQQKKQLQETTQEQIAAESQQLEHQIGDALIGRARPQTQLMSQWRQEVDEEDQGALRLAIQESVRTGKIEIPVATQLLLEAEESLRGRLGRVELEPSFELDLGALKPAATANIEKRKKLQKGVVRLLPQRIGKVAIFLGSAILLTAVVGMILHYGGHVQALHFLDSNTPLTMQTIIKFGLSGFFVGLGGALQILGTRSGEQVQAFDEKEEALRREIALQEKQLEHSNQEYRDRLEVLRLLSLKAPDTTYRVPRDQTDLELQVVNLSTRLDSLKADRERRLALQKRRAVIQRIVGGVVIGSALLLLALQFWALDATSFQALFHVQLPTDLPSMASVFSYAAGIVIGGLALIHNAREFTEDLERSSLKTKKQEIELRLKRKQLDIDLIRARRHHLAQMIHVQQEAPEPTEGLRQRRPLHIKA